MNPRLTAIARRRAALVAQAAAQRQDLDRLIRPWQMPLALTDHGIALVRRLRAHPLVIVVGVALLSRMGRGRLGVWVGRIWTAWQLYRSLQDQRLRDQA
jgi:hypothetical protein